MSFENPFKKPNPNPDEVYDEAEKLNEEYEKARIGVEESAYKAYHSRIESNSFDEIQKLEEERWEDYEKKLDVFLDVYKGANGISNFDEFLLKFKDFNKHALREVVEEKIPHEEIFDKFNKNVGYDKVIKERRESAPGGMQGGSPK